MWTVLLRWARPAADQISGGQMTWADAEPKMREYWNGRIRPARQQITQIEAKLTAE